MSDNGIQNRLEKLWMNDTINRRLILACVSIGNLFQTMIDESLKLSQSMDEFKVVADKFDGLDYDIVLNYDKPLLQSVIEVVSR